MIRLTYLNDQGDFALYGAQRAGDMVFPLVNAAGMMSSVTPRLAGDCKTGQNTFLLAPASVETLHESRASRNFFLALPDKGLWSVAGVSAAQQAQLYEETERATVYGGLLWHELVRESPALGCRARVLSFVPSDDKTVELMRVTVENTGGAPLSFTPTAAIPLYGRSADNIRDHRHVTSLLNRLTVTAEGVRLAPTMTFDERGHRPGNTAYTVLGRDDRGNAPIRFLGPVQDYVGCGSYDWPQALVQQGAAWMGPGDTAAGYEMVAALQFGPVTLAPGESKSWYIALGINAEGSEYLAPAAFDAALQRTKAHWQSIGAAAFHTGDEEVDRWLRWVAIQPELRRICGCSFLPHHDYGRGGRGWRDLWQDSLALILRSPGAVRRDLVRYFAGVRRDGTNATIIGSRPGEFLADRNNIVRVWMDHGYWPLVTLQEYIRQSGDERVLLEKQPWFWDKRKMRGETVVEEAPPSTRLHSGGNIVESTVLEHLLVQNVTAFFDAGQHGCIRLRGADWNDALDMAADRGESVAFTAAYAGNLRALAALCDQLREAGESQISLGGDFARLLLSDPAVYETPDSRNAARRQYEAACEDQQDRPVPLTDAAQALRGMADWLTEHLRKQEFLRDQDGCGWMNSYYDNDGQRVEGKRPDGVRMMLTGQVFALMSGTADEAQTDAIIRAADAYLFDEARGGYCLNTDFGGDIPPLGRQFGFAWGHKENGAVFSHMAVMYAYALLKNGRTEAGSNVLNALIRQSMRVEISRVYPGIPEYFDPRGRGMYPYLTGAGSWLMLCLITMAFGVRGEGDDLTFAPHLTAKQFDARGEAAIRCFFAGREIQVVYHRPGENAPQPWRVGGVSMDGRAYPAGRVPRQALLKAACPRVDIELKGGMDQ
ncbi:MAG: cellobiose phosphorylase [Clostridia bacterium]|nr:cellobiose phosphorylase [Clostridia bacterium]